jgi:transcriptional regulator GlxA family with amidase domain
MPCNDSNAHTGRWGAVPIGPAPPKATTGAKTMAAQRTVVILIFDDAEVLDFCGPLEVFSVTGRDRDPRPFRVVLAAERHGPVLARNGLSVNPDYTLADCPRADLVLVPGGQGTRKLMHNAAVVDWVRRRAAEAELVLSVCTGALILAKAGLLDGLVATTHHGALDLLRQTAPNTTIRENTRFVDNGRIITSGGIAAGIDMALHVVGRLLSSEVAAETARHMEYPWSADGGWGAGQE